MSCYFLGLFCNPFFYDAVLVFYYCTTIIGSSTLLLVVPLAYYYPQILIHSSRPIPGRN